MRAITLILLLATMVPHATVRADQLDSSLTGPNVLIRYPKGARKWADLALRQFPDADRHAIQTLGITANRRVNVHLYTSSAAFRKDTGWDLSDTLGVAMPAANLIAIDCTKAELRGPNSFAITLRHEMIHIAFGRLEARTGERVPLWFNEGVATWSSGRILEGDPKALVTAINTGTLIPLAQIEHSFPESRIGRELAYQQSESTIAFIVHEFGDGSLRRIVRLMEDGNDFSAALSIVAPGIDFESAWKEYVKRRYPMLNFLQNLFSLLTVAAFLTIIAYGIYRLRRRRKLREWHEEERILYGDHDDYPDVAEEEEDT